MVLALGKKSGFSVIDKGSFSIRNKGGFSVSNKGGLRFGIRIELWLGVIRVSRVYHKE